MDINFNVASEHLIEGCETVSVAVVKTTVVMLKNGIYDKLWWWRVILVFFFLFYRLF